LVDDLLVIDAFQELAGQMHACGLAALPQLVEKAVRDQLQAFFDQLVVDLALLLDLVGSLEPGGEPGLELAKANVVEAGGVDVVSGDVAVGFPAQLDGPVHCPVRRARVVDRDEDLADWAEDRKSTRLNSSHGSVSDAAFCLEKSMGNETL